MSSTQPTNLHRQPHGLTPHSSQYLLPPTEACLETPTASQHLTTMQTPPHSNTPLRHQQPTGRETASQSTLRINSPSPSDIRSSYGTGAGDTGGNDDLDTESTFLDEDQTEQRHEAMDGDAGWDPSIFLDGVANYMHLNDEEREELDAFAKVGSHTVQDKEHLQILPTQLGQGLSKPDLATRVYLLASNLRVGSQRVQLVELSTKLFSVLADVEVRLDTKFNVSGEQMVRIQMDED